MVDERQCEVCAASIKSGPDGMERPRSRWVPDVKVLSGRGSGDRVMKRTHARAWRDSRNRSGCKSDGGARSLASSFSRRAHCRRTGGGSHSWRGAKNCCVRTRLLWAAMRRSGRALLGRLALALSPHRGLLLTGCAASEVQVRQEVSGSTATYAGSSEASRSSRVGHTPTSS